MEISIGLRDFLAACLVCFQSQKLRQWYFRRLLKSAMLGLIILLVFLGLISFGIWSLFQYLSVFVPADWLVGALGAALVALWALGLYFTVGPISLLFINFLLTQFGGWKELRKIYRLPEEAHLSLPQSFQENTKGLMRALLLSLLILGASIFAFIPFLVFIPFVVAAFALSKDWIWMTEELYHGRQKQPASVSYCVGLGLIPALTASLPIVGVASLPILQVACLLRYEKIHSSQ